MKSNNMFNDIKRAVAVRCKGAMATLCLGAAVAGLTSSCADFFEPESDRIIYADKDHLNNATDTIYSVAGILGKLQALADRTILLGEVRGDLVDINTNTSSDLRDVALFNIGDDNAYNSPSDYYAVINNCNYFIAKADTALKNNRNEKIFMKEYAAVKGIRAWTYLQLALNYGNVPFVTTPILTKEEAERSYEQKGIADICDWLIKDIQSMADEEMPGYGAIRGFDSRLMYFPIYLMLGELNLWAGHYKEAALNYYNYISKRNGTNSAYPIGSPRGVFWPNGTTSFTRYTNVNDNYSYSFGNEYYGTNSEYITIIPGDSIPSEGNYSQLRNLFNCTSDNNAKFSLTPSQSMKDISAAQTCTYVISNNSGVAKYGIAPKGIGYMRDGDLRLCNVYKQMDNAILDGERVEYQTILKYSTRNIPVYRRTTVYLRLAEAMNRAGYPHFAYYVLASGVNNKVITDSIMKYYPSAEDSAFLSRFDFPSTRYVLRTPDMLNNENTMGIHDLGCGWSLQNPDYQMPFDSTYIDKSTGYYKSAADSTLERQYQMDKVEQMIVDECALENCFEGTRFYDLMRVALRRGDPNFLADRVYARRGEANKGAMEGEIKVNLRNANNWYLHWNGKIGIEPVADNKEQ